MIDPHSRVVSFGGSSVRIDCVGDQSGFLLDLLFGDLPPSPGPPPHLTLRVRADSVSGVYTLDGAGARHRAASTGELASALLDRTTYHLADRSRGGLLLHAAAVRSTKGCLVLPGTTGAGKTMLAAWLARRGFGYLTDELVYVPLGSQDVHAFVRPLRFKASAGLVSGMPIVDCGGAASLTLDDRGATIVCARLLGGTIPSSAAVLDGLVFPRYEASAPFRLEPLSSGRAALELMACLINARNLPAHGFREVTRLVRQVRPFALKYGDFSQIERWAEGLPGRENLADGC
jgi:hypothetical protein